MLLLDVALDHFADPERAGRWFDTADDAEQLVVRPADPIDGATPSGAALDRRGAATAAHLAPAARADRYDAAAAAALHAAHTDPGEGAALGRALAGGRRGRGARADPDRRRLRPADSELLAAARPLAPGGAVVVGRCGGLVGTARRPRPGRRARRRLRLPWPDVRPARHDRRGTRRRAGCRRVACRACDCRRPQPSSTATWTRSPPAPPPTWPRCTPTTPRWRTRWVAARSTSGGRPSRGFYKALRGRSRRRPSCSRSARAATRRRSSSRSPSARARAACASRPIEVMTSTARGRSPR